MQEFGIGLVNAQAAEIDKLVYPDFAGGKCWLPTGTVGQDEQGYDIHRLVCDEEEMDVPANRLVVIARMLERLRS